MKDNIILKIYKLGQIIIVLLALILIVLIIGVSKLYNTNSNNNTNETNYNTDYDVSMFKEINASDIKTETKDNLSVVYIGRSTCGWCAAFLPNLWQAEKEYGYETLYEINNRSGWIDAGTLEEYIKALDYEIELGARHE